MKKMQMQTKDFTKENVAKIAALFPNCVTEARDERGNIRQMVDFEALQQELSYDLISEKQERYQFTWPDKKKAFITANQPIRKTLRPCREESVNFDTTENLYIEGDNLEVLKLLQETYNNSIKMIYIDPPYNTGHDFVYKDDFAQDADDYVENSGQRDEEGNRYFQNMETNGRFHTDWLNMMYPRLKLAKNLLTEDGVIFISIDDNEVRNLKILCDEIFGEQNFVAQVVWRKIYGIKNDVKTFSNCHEYVLVYVRTMDLWSPNLLPRTEEANKRYKNPDNDPRGPWKAGDFTGIGATSCVYPITSPSGRIFYPPEGKHWIYSKDNFEDLLKDNRIWFGDNGNNVPSVKRFLSEVKQGMSPSTFFDYTEVGHTDEANRALKELMGGPIFSYPKPVKLTHRLAFLGTDKDSIILDFFSGSATTAHAVMQLNAEDGGKRKFIMVQLQEECPEDSEAFKAGYKNICEIGKERIRRAGKKIVEETGLVAEGLDIGFRVLKVDSSNMKDVYYTPSETLTIDLDGLMENIKEDRTPEDLLFQVMLDIGIELSEKITTFEVQGKTVYDVMDGYMLACFDANLTDEVITEIAKHQPDYFVTRDGSIGKDSTLDNFEQIFKQYSPNTEKKVI